MHTNILSVISAEDYSAIQMRQNGLENTCSTAKYVSFKIETTLDKLAYIPFVGLIAAVVQFVYGFFEAIVGILTCDKTLAYRGGINLFRGAVQMIPHFGCYIMGKIDEQPITQEAEDFNAKNYKGWLRG